MSDSLEGMLRYRSLIEWHPTTSSPLEKVTGVWAAPADHIHDDRVRSSMGGNMSDISRGGAGSQDDVPRELLTANHPGHN